MNGPHGRMAQRFLLVAAGLFLFCVALLPARRVPAGDPTPHVTWAGRQVVEGSVRIPVVGTRTTRTETWVLLRQIETETGFVLEQEGCRVVFDRIAGVSVEMSDATARRLPMVPVHYDRQDDGSYRARPSRVAWGAEDVDESGTPGATVRVRAPLCSGEVYVASETDSVSTARRSADVIEGRIRLQVRQRILGASRPCLRWFTSDSVDLMAGNFRYEPVPEGTTCDDLVAGSP